MAQQEINSSGKNSSGREKQQRLCLFFIQIISCTSLQQKCTRDDLALLFSAAAQLANLVYLKKFSTLSNFFKRINFDPCYKHYIISLKKKWFDCQR
jgi:hypothetical protein